MLTGLQLCEKVLSETKVAMTSSQIWSHAVENGYDRLAGIKGKTPARTIQAQMYVDIRDKSDSRFVQVSSRPPMFGLKDLTYPDVVQASEEPSQVRFRERDLHPLLVSYLDSDAKFRSHSKTIFHESSTKSKRNAEKWMHPDIVSVHFPFEDFKEESVELAKNAGLTGIILYSFELKVSVTGSNVREYYFQAVSNSSWANEGYLVALEFSEDALTQLSSLNQSFGIGAIRLNPDDIHQSEILIPSKENEFIDVVAIDNLVRINPDFKKFVSSINDSMKTSRVIRGDYDAVMADDELQEYIIRKGIVEKAD